MIHKITLTTVYYKLAIIRHTLANYIEQKLLLLFQKTQHITIQYPKITISTIPITLTATTIVSLYSYLTLKGLPFLFYEAMNELNAYSLFYIAFLFPLAFLFISSLPITTSGLIYIILRKKNCENYRQTLLLFILFETMLFINITFALGIKYQINCRTITTMTMFSWYIIMIGTIIVNAQPSFFTSLKNIPSALLFITISYLLFSIFNPSYLVKYGDLGERYQPIYVNEQLKNYPTIIQNLNYHKSNDQIHPWIVFQTKQSIVMSHNKSSKKLYVFGKKPYRLISIIDNSKKSSRL